MNTLNLSGIALSTHELSILSKGLTFVPKPKSMNKMELYQDAQNFVRKLRLQYLMYNKPAKLPIPFQAQQ